jgi:hypothetical protein
MNEKEKATEEKAQTVAQKTDEKKTTEGSKEKVNPAVKGEEQPQVKEEARLNIPEYLIPIFVLTQAFRVMTNLIHQTGWELAFKEAGMEVKQIMDNWVFDMDKRQIVKYARPEEKSEEKKEEKND